MTARHFDLLLKGACVLTGDEANSVLEDAAIGIADGRIAYLAEGPVPEGITAERTIGLSGRVVTPGFVNVHTHANLSMVRGVAEDLGFAPAYTRGIPQGHMVTRCEAVALARLGALEALLFGSTLINDSFVHADAVTGAMTDLGLRVWSCGRIHDVDFSGVSLGRWNYDESIGETTLAHALALADSYGSSPDLMTGVQLAAHAPDTCSTPFLRRIGEAARARGLRVTTHLSQSRVELDHIRERDGRTPPELLDEVGLLHDQLLAAHCIHVTPDDIRLIGGAAANVVHIPKGNATGATMAPTGRLRDAGARIALATDNMQADMIETMRWALAVGRLGEGRVDDRWQPSTVFRMATMGGAEAMGLEKEIGSIEPGKRADLVALGFARPHLTPATDPLGNLVHVAQGRDVELVVVEGRVVVEDGRPTLADMHEVMREARLAAAALWSRAR